MCGMLQPSAAPKTAEAAPAGVSLVSPAAGAVPPVSSDSAMLLPPASPPASPGSD